MPRPISIAVRGGTCFTEQESSDEPYVITSVVDLTNKVSFAGQTFIFPAVNTTRTGPLSGIDSGVTFRTRSLLPGTTALMEHDDSKFEVVRGTVEGLVTAGANAVANAKPPSTGRQS